MKDYILMPRELTAENGRSEEKMNDLDSKYEGELVRISTNEGDKYVPAFYVDECPGLAITLSSVGKFTVTHIATGLGVCKGNYERHANAVLLVVRLTFIAKTYGFSWEDDNIKDHLAKIFMQPVPFIGATVTDRDGERPMTIQSFIEGLRPVIPLGDIDTPLLEDDNPLDMAADILGEFSA